MFLGPQKLASFEPTSLSRVYAHVAREVNERTANAVASAIQSVTNPLPFSPEAVSTEKIKTTQSLKPQGFPMVGAGTIEELEIA